MRLASLPAPRGPSMAGRRPDDPQAPAVGSSLTPEVLVILNPVPWPNGAKCAVCFTLDMDAESLLYLAHPQRAHSMVSASSMLRYGPDVAVPRILDDVPTLWDPADLLRARLVRGAISVRASRRWCVKAMRYRHMDTCTSIRTNCRMRTRKSACCAAFLPFDR